MFRNDKIKISNYSITCYYCKFIIAAISYTIC